MLFIQRRFCLKIIFIIILSQLFFCFPVYTQENNHIDFKTLEYVIKSIHYNYVEDIPQIDVVNFALKSIKKYLINLKSDTSFVKEISTDLSPSEQIKQLKLICQSILKKHPKVKATLFYNFVIINTLKELNDPYTMFLSPRMYKVLMEQMKGGNYGGLGIIIELDKKKNNLLTVVEPVEGTPAWKAGLKKRDQIIAVNGKSTKNISLEKAQKLLRGAVGSRVTLTIRSPKTRKIRKVTLVRALIHIKSLSYKIINGNIGYIKLKVFGEYTNDELNEALNYFLNHKVKGYILDVRNNGGGYIKSAFDTCSKFLPPGTLIVKVYGKNMPKEEFFSRPNARHSLPLVILINEFSASASEITAGAIKSSKSGILVGAKTFGKASVQRLILFPSGAALKVTTAHYYTPEGENINKVGIKPDIEISEKAEKQDQQLKKALEILNSEIAKEKLPSAWVLNSDEIIKIKNLQDEFNYLQNKFGKDIKIKREIITRRSNHFIDQTEVKSGLSPRETKVYFDLDKFFN